MLFIAFNEEGAADDEEPPRDAAGKEHGDDTGECHMQRMGL